MKNLNTLALLGILAAGCTSESGYNVSGEISGLENDTILIFANDPVNKKTVITDTVPVTNNKFKALLPDSDLLYINIIEKPIGNKAMRIITTPPFILLKGEKLSISGDIENLQASGTAIYDDLAKAHEIRSYQEKARTISLEYTETLKSKDIKDIDRREALIGEMINNGKSLSKEKLNYIKKNPDSNTSGYFYTSLLPEHKEEAYNALGEKVKNGPLNKLIASSKEMYEAFAAKEKAKENIAPGKPAPDFKLKNLDNKEMALADFRGKYVLLDFWGTWCGWCIKGMPDMKKYYSKYKNKMEIVGICCRDTEERWRKGVKDLELPWTNLYNGDGKDIVINYAISGYPTKILIDPEGKIVEVFVGESEEMYKKLDELFK